MMQDQEKVWSLTKISAELGVSICTVSAVLNGRARALHIKPATIDRIQSFCNGIGYQPNIHTRRMRSRIVNNILFYFSTLADIKASFSDSNLFNVQRGILHAAKAAHVTVSVRSGDVKEAAEGIFRSFRSREIDGMIHYGVEIPPEWIEVFRQEKRHVVGISVKGSQAVPAVNINNREISRRMVIEYLLKRGRRTFLYLGGKLDSFPGNERYAGFREALAEYGIAFPEKRFILCNFDDKEAYAAMENFLASGESLPDAVVCANDLMAVGAVHSLLQHGIKVPGQIAVCGGDGIEIGRHMTPRIAGFDYQAISMGIAAFDMLWHEVNGESVENKILETRLLEGDSV